MNNKITCIEANLNAKDLSVAIISTRWNNFIVDELVKGAILTFTQHGGEEKNITHFIAPGSFEIPLIAKKAAQSKKFDAIICLGAVIKGDTDHYNFVANNVSSGILNVSIETKTPIAFGILTTDTVEQALNRAGIKMGNKGSESMLAMIESVNLLKQIN